MKLRSLLSLVTLLQIYSNVCGEDCMSNVQIVVAIKILCQRHRNNLALWQKVIDCHRPISDEFLRSSGEVQCPIPKQVENPTDTDYTIQEVSFNICGFIDGGLINQIRSTRCVLLGQGSIMSHATERAAVQATWGNDVPCNIGKCIMKLGFMI